MIEFYELVKNLNIVCNKCLDTQLLWKNRNHNDDMKGYFIVISCDVCSDSRFIDYSHTSNMTFNGIPIFHIDSIEHSVRFPILRKLYNNKSISQNEHSY